MAAAVLIGGFFRVALPFGAAPQIGQSKSSTKLQTSESKPVKGAFANEITQKIAESFGCSDEPANPPVSPESVNWRVPPSSRPFAKFIVAFVPDPIHTHLSLLFDRDVEAMESAVPQMNFGTEAIPQNFVFDRSILPWRTPSAESVSDPKSAEIVAAERADRESFPGLLIFRKNGDHGVPPPNNESEGGCSSRETLFIFLVAETPTSGIRTLQFKNALRIMRGIRAGAKSSGQEQEPLLLLGPNFSGSLESLQRQLEQIPKTQNIFVYSGTVTGASSAATFRQSFSDRQSSPETGKVNVRFASFQQSDEYAIKMFVRFAYCRGYDPGEIAVLSEVDTVYGSQAKLDYREGQNNFKFSPKCRISDDFDDPGHFERLIDDMVYLNFPREISSFRSAYEKQLASQPQAARIPGKSSLSSDVEEEGKDDDVVASFANGQTALSQEAVMLSLVTELQKHHIKFTVLLATNPVDQVFLARYLRTNYPQGRIVVTTPDLMLASQEDTLLYGVLGLNAYSLVPGLSDSLCHFESAGSSHTDRLFHSSTSVGVYNATLGLMTILAGRFQPDSHVVDDVPVAQYADFATPDLTLPGKNETTCESTPLLWITVLGRDGYWPIAGLTSLDASARSSDFDLPIVPTFEPLGTYSTLPYASGDPTPEDINLHTRTAWNVAYSICLATIVLHLFLSWTGSFLSNWEAQAQFARSHNRLGVYVLAIGAFWLATCFVLLMCTRNPLISWRTTWGLPLTILLWLPLPALVGFTVYDMAKHRNQPKIAWILAGLISAMTLFQILLACNQIPWLPYTWSTRLIHLSSGVSPVLPFVLLCVAGYWWAWLSLRSVAIVDLRRPRLPAASHLPQTAVRFSDVEGEKVRKTAHPLRFAWRIAAILGILLLVSLTSLEWRHPLQSLEGVVYDWGYSLALGAAIAVFLSCLIRLVLTWVDYKQVLSALDHSPLREAFSRMKRLSWSSMWNPGGSTLRETYRVMSRTIENMTHLKKALAEEKQKPHGAFFQSRIPNTKVADFDAVTKQIEETENRICIAQRIYRALTLQNGQTGNNGSNATHPSIEKIPDVQKRLEALLQRYDAYVLQKAESVKCPAETVCDVRCKQGLLALFVERCRALLLRLDHSEVSGAASAELLAKIDAAFSQFDSAVKEIEELFKKCETGKKEAEKEIAVNKECFKNIAATLEELNGALEKYLKHFSYESLEQKNGDEKTEEGKPAACKEVRAELVIGLMDSVEALQKQLANTAGTVFKRILEPIWNDEILPSVSQDDRIDRPKLEIMRAISEEFVALVYVNFLQSVLLQMRSLVICAGGMYVLILCSMGVYPFEPHPALQVLGVVLVVVMAIAVGFVYAEMHRDAILSRLTSTTAGELGWDFWLKFISAGAIPVFSLLAVQFPEISKFLFSWLEPAVQAIK
jgi:hypothetical protein